MKQSNHKSVPPDPPSSSKETELREKAQLVSKMIKLQGNPNSSALVKVDLWAVADFVQLLLKEAYESGLETGHMAEAEYQTRLKSTE